ncbi:hypothetical protein CK203_104257 [Vitis vinifera]|uniref:Uncharacterized protein n=1 Tax=Vitis vinifera TaxID=29760 RepID=A0A438C5V7_VITVI|nr:hypothetical protein CK203_104257 [Vitis vinifera]
MGEPSPLGNPSRNARKCMCRGDDHLTWKHPVSLEVCKGLCTTGGYEYQFEYTWVVCLITFYSVPTELPLYNVSSSVSVFIGVFSCPIWICLRGLELEPAPILALEDAHAHMDRLKLYMVYRRALLEDCGPSLPLVIQRGRSPQGGQRPGDVGTISSTGSRSPKHYQTFGQTLGAYYPQRYVQYKPPRPMAPTYLHQTLEPIFATQGLGHDTDHCVTLRHAIQDLIDQGLVNLGQPSVTTRPLPTHSMHAMPPPPGVDTVGSQTSTPFSFDFKLRERCTDCNPQWESSSVLTSSSQASPLVARPFDGVVSHEEVRKEDDGLLRQLQSIHAHISIWSLLASSSTQRDALIQALSHIQVETTTTLKGLIHMMTVDKATCIVFLDDDLPPEGLDHTCPLYITVGCSGHRVPSILLDNGSAFERLPISYCYRPWLCTFRLWSLYIDGQSI